MIKHLLSMLNNDDGATLVDYALLVALVAGVSAIALHTLSNNVGASGTTLATQMQTAPSNVVAQ